MKNYEKKVALSVLVSRETRIVLKKMAIDENKTMAAMFEEIIAIAWKKINANKDGTL